MPANAIMITMVVKNISHFSILQEKNVKAWLEKHVFSKTPLLMELLVNQGIFVTSIIVLAVLIGITMVGKHINIVRPIFL
jgi:hypothetical protein